MSATNGSSAVTERWRNIRGNPRCDLSLAPESVAEFLRIPESRLVSDRIRETLIQLAGYRIKKNGYRSSKEPTAPGLLATCEGLETFLVPAVEGALSFSAVLLALPNKSVFANTVVSDINELLDHWGNGRFTGEPYATEESILGALLPIHAVRIRRLDIVEAAAMACRVVTHVLTLKLMRDDEREFRSLIGDKIDEQKLVTALTKAIEFLVASFRETARPDTGKKAAPGRAPSAGWSWTDWPGLPPILFFTAAAVDAFAELDLYLIRVAEDATLGEHPGRIKLAAFCKDNADSLERFQNCLEAARHWVQDEVLPALSIGSGFYPEDEVSKDLTKIEKFKDELEAEGLQSPTLLYNSLYGLQVLLWCWADWDATGMNEDARTKSAINRALVQLVYNYNSLPLARKVLAEADYVIHLPGKDYFKDKTEADRRYLDAGFLPLLTRLLVLFVVYGVGDRNLLEPVIRNLYVELLQNRHRNDPDVTALWSADAIQIFSTQRAIQALTFYFAYAAGKEKADGSRSGDDGAAPSPDRIQLRSNIGVPLILEARLDGAYPGNEPAREPVAPPVGIPNPSAAATFTAYCKQIAGHTVAAAIGQPDVTELQDAIIDEGNNLLKAANAGETNDPVLANFILYSLARLLETPWKLGEARKDEFRLLSNMARELLARAK